jgi:DNA-binding PadR family transcriptional regulator
MTTKAKQNIAKDILDKWATVVLRNSAIHEQDGVSIPDGKQAEDYKPENYNNDIVLWIPPKDCIRLEFEGEPEQNLRIIREIESAAKTLNLDYCITEHEGRKSPYFNMFNIQGIPVNDDNKLAKDLLIDIMVPQSAKGLLDKTNLGWTWSPVIEHEHWKKKYGGAIHAIIRGKNPLEHNNEYPKDLLRLIKKSKQVNKKTLIRTRQSNQWVEDFLINYCCNNKLPPGNRHFIIEKNLAALIIHRPDRDQILERYLKMQGRTGNTLRTWFNAILNGQFNEVSPGELVNYIKTNQIPYVIVDIVNKEERTFIATPDEHTLLMDPALIEKICDNELDKKIVEEKESRKAIFLNACGCWVENASISSFNLCLNSKSGAGKDYVVKNVLKIFPKELIEVRTRISPTVFTYWHNSRFEPEFTWDGKVLVLLDISNTILNCDVFKLMCSDGTNSTVVIEQRAVDIEIKGKPVIFITTASANPQNEMLRRFPFLELDETTDQTKAIKKAQAKAAAAGKAIEYDPLITKALSKLQRVKVKIPFAEDLVESFPSEHLIMRTHFSRLLDIIKASAAVHQFQRKRDDDGAVIAEPADYNNAIISLKVTTSNPQMIPLSYKQKMLLEECKKLKKFSVKQLEPHIPFLVQSKIYDTLADLQELGFLSSFLDETTDSKKPVRYYQPINFEIEEIPNWDQIKEKCRKKGIKGIEGNEGIKGNKGIDKNNRRKVTKKHKKNKKPMRNTNTNNSLNSPPKPPLEKTKSCINDAQKAEYLTKIENLMSTKSRHDWAINDICFQLGIASLQNRKEIGELLERTAADPKNPTRIRKVDELGLFWHLAEADQ